MFPIMHLPHLFEINFCLSILLISTLVGILFFNSSLASPGQPCHIRCAAFSLDPDRRHNLQISSIINILSGYLLFTYHFLHKDKSLPATLDPDTE